jgi:hypothetical protein
LRRAGGQRTTTVTGSNTDFERDSHFGGRLGEHVTSMRMRDRVSRTAFGEIALRVHSQRVSSLEREGDCEGNCKRNATMCSEASKTVDISYALQKPRQTTTRKRARQKEQGSQHSTAQRILILIVQHVQSHHSVQCSTLVDLVALEMQNKSRGQRKVRDRHCAKSHAQTASTVVNLSELGRKHHILSVHARESQ